MSGAASMANPFVGGRLLHTMLRVGDLDRSLHFYIGTLGMRLLRRQEFPQGRFTLAFIGYDEEAAGTVLELTHNWDTTGYEPGSGYGHLAIQVADVYAACDALAAAGVNITRPAGPMKHAAADGGEADVIAFVEDPDGYKIELIEGRRRAAAQ